MADLSMNVNYAKPQTTSLGDMLGMASGIQNFQQAQQMNPLALQRAQQEVEQARQMNPLALQRAMMEIEQAKQMNPLAVRKSAAETQVAEETVKPRISQAESQSAKAMSEAQSAQLDTTRAFLNNARRETTQLINKKDLTVDDVKEHYKNNIYNAVDDPQVRERTYNQAIAKLPKNPTDLRQYLIRDLTGTVAAETQLEKLFPTTQMVSAGSKIIPVAGGNQQLSMSGQPGQQVGQPIDIGVSPSQREEVSGTDIYGNPIATVKDEFGRVIGQKGVPVMGQPTPAPMPMRFAPGESPETVKAMQAERIMAKDSAAAAAPALTNIQTVRKYLPLAATGANSEAIAKLQSVVGNVGGSKPEELAAASRDIIEKSIADLALQKNQALGGKYVEDLKGAAQSLASAGRNPTAIAKSMDQLEPLIQHAQYYQQGLENAIAKNKGDVQIKRKFDNDMIKAYDPQALGAYNAYTQGGEPALNKYLQEISPDKKKPVPPGLKANIFIKMQRYVNLVNGDL